MKITLLIILLFILGNRSRAQYVYVNSDNHYTIRVLSYGYPGSDLFQRYKVAKKYHFKLVTIAGCLISNKDADSAQKLNAISYRLLDSIHGKGWQDKYEADVQQMYSRDSSLIAMVKAYEVKEKYEKGWIYQVDSVVENKMARVNVVDATPKLASVRRFYVHIPSGKMIKIEQEAILLDKQRLIDGE